MLTALAVAYFALGVKRTPPREDAAAGAAGAHPAEAAAEARSPAPEAEREIIPLALRMIASSSDEAYALAPRGNAVHASHPGRALETTFRTRDVLVEGAAARAELSFEGVTREGVDVAVARPAAPAVEANRVQYDRGEGITEWWAHGEPGLELGFTLDTRPEGDAEAMSLVLNVAGDVSPVADQERVLLRDARGETAFVISELAAYDAEGRALETRFEVQGTRIAMHVRDEGARYPIVVDPFITPTETLTVSSGQASDAFGASIVMNTSWALVSAVGEDLGTNRDSGAVHVYARSGNRFVQRQTLRPPPPASGVQDTFEFGGFLALGTRYALVSARFTDVGAVSNAGVVYVYEIVSGVFTQRARLVSPAPMTHGLFGWNLALDGTTAVISEPYATSGGVSIAGRVYVYDGADGTFDLVQTLEAPPTGAGWFGLGIALRGDLLVVGSPIAGSGTLGSGVAHVYRHGASGFALESALPHTATAQSAFGFRVAITSENAVVVSAPSEDAGKGALYAFTRNGTTWTRTRRWTLPADAQPAGLGISLSAYGDRVVAGAHTYRSGGIATGAAFVFDPAAGGNAPDETLLVPAGAANDEHGFAVAGAGGYVLVGAPRRDLGGRADQGAVYLTHVTGSSWADGAPIQQPTHEWALFGDSIAISGDHAVVGARLRLVNGLYAGALYPYERVSGTWLPKAMIPSPFPKNIGNFGGALAMSGDTLVVADPYSDVNGRVNAGRAHIYEHDGTGWQSVAVLTAATPVAEDRFGIGVAIEGDTIVIGDTRCDVGVLNGGCAHVYTRTAGAWTRTASLSPTLPRSDSMCGLSVGISGARIVLGCPTRNIDADPAIEGAVYTFTRDAAGAWTEESIFTPHEQSTIEYGWVTSLRGSVLVIAAPGAPVGGAPRVGIAWVHTNYGQGWSLVKTFTGPGGHDYTEFATSIAQFGDQIVFGVPKLDRDGQDAGAVFLARRIGLTYVLNTELTAPDPAELDNFGSAIGVANDGLWMGASWRNDRNGIVYRFNAR